LGRNETIKYGLGSYPKEYKKGEVINGESEERKWKSTCMKKGGQAEKGLHHPGIFMQFPGSEDVASGLPPGVRLGIYLCAHLRTLHAIVDIYRREASGKYL
jgi:hypothetical protein